ncbi:MAG: RNA polymerase sigma factor [Rhodothermales bacterium]|nr:RNA polymerase sigma factor [Rhodothermales bacterium]MBO6780108.1 RNA polymerase sigma factor [Rhodothermales bacterium]
MDAQETRLVRLAQQGDAGAFDALVRANEARLLHAIAGILGRTPAVYDVYQDTLVKAYTKLPGFRLDSAFSTWITRIAINRALNQKRKEKNARQDPLEFAQHIPSRGPSASLAVERAEMRASTERAMERLSERERAVFVLKHQHGYKLREIGDMLSCAEGTVKNYLFRATRKLREELEPVYREM